MRVTKKFKKFGRKEAFVLFLIFWIIPYCTLGYLNELREINSLPLWFDNMIPFWPPAILGYVLYFPLCFFTFLVIKDEWLLRRGIEAFIFEVLMTCLFFIVFPTFMPRPEVVGSGFFENMISKMWELDTSANAFPSQHVSNSFICAFLIGKQYEWLRPFLILVAVIIAVSTVFVKQHYVWDVISGFFIALIAYHLAFKKESV